MCGRLYANLPQASQSQPSVLTGVDCTQTTVTLNVVGQTGLVLLSQINGIISTVAGTGARGFEGDGGPAVNAKLLGPASVAVHMAGNIYIADSRNHRIRKVTPAGQIMTVAGSGAVDTFDAKGFPIFWRRLR